jgi:2-methylcitrate dehydratase PrpD
MPVTRRELLKSGGFTLAASAIRRVSLFAQPVGSVMQTLSAYMAEAAGRSLPADAVEHTKHHILDTFAAMISGSELPPGQAAIRFARESASGKGTSTIAAAALVTGPIDAALANGVLAHSDETDDSHSASQSHPGAAVVPAALAAGEHFGVSGTAFLRAVALGYDVGTRMTMAMGGSDFRIESHRSTHSIAGGFGAAAAAGSAARLSAQQMRWMLDYAAQQSSGIASWARDIDHIEKGFVFAGMPARSGVTAALLVQLGWNGVDDVLSGDDNFFLAYAPKSNPSLLVDGLGSRYEVTRTDIKKWTVGTPIQAPLDAIERLRAKRAFKADDVRQVVVRLAPSVAAVVDNRDIPDICLQHMMAVMLIDGTASFKAAHDKPRMQDPSVLRQRAKVQLVKDESLAALLPVRVAVVEVTLNDGTRVSDRVEAVRGTPRNPMMRQEIVAKATDRMVPVLGAEKTRELVDTVYTLDRVAALVDLRPLLQRL